MRASTSGLAMPPLPSAIALTAVSSSAARHVLAQGTRRPGRRIAASTCSSSCRGRPDQHPTGRALQPPPGSGQGPSSPLGTSVGDQHVLQAVAAPDRPPRPRPKASPSHHDSPAVPCPPLPTPSRSVPSESRRSMPWLFGAPSRGCAPGSRLCPATVPRPAALFRRHSGAPCPRSFLLSPGLSAALSQPAVLLRGCSRDGVQGRWCCCAGLRVTVPGVVCFCPGCVSVTSRRWLLRVPGFFGAPPPGPSCRPGVLDGAGGGRGGRSIRSGPCKARPVQVATSTQQHAHGWAVVGPLGVTLGDSSSTRGLDTQRRETG